MGLPSYKISVPGSLMLFGEHAVLHKKQAIVAAVDSYIEIELIPRSDKTIHIVSEALGNCKVSLNGFRVVKPHNYVLTAAQQFMKKIKTGFTLNIKSDFPHDIGFGSSAAVTVATLGALSLWLNKKVIDHVELYRQAVKVVRLAQGFGSGADVAASVFGGVLLYTPNPFSVKKLTDDLQLVAVYSGGKVSTSKVVAKVEQQRKLFPKVFSGLYGAIDCCTKEAASAIQKKQYPRLGELMNIHQGLQDGLGINNEILSELIFALRKGKNIYGAKISGSGLGDCVIGLGKIKKNTFPVDKVQKKNGVRQIDVGVSDRGLGI